MRALAAFRARLHADGGYSLPELIVATAVALIVIGGAMTMLVTVLRAQPVTSDRSGQVGAGRTMIERVTRELRQAESVITATPTNLEMVTYVDSASCGGAPAPTAIACRVAYACAGDSCTRTERNANGSGTVTPRLVVTALRNPAVFGYEPASNPTYVSVTLEFAGDDGDETITLRDGAAPRNWFEPGGGPA